MGQIRSPLPIPDIYTAGLIGLPLPPVQVKHNCVVPWLNWIEQPPPKGQVIGSNPIGVTSIFLMSEKEDVCAKESNLAGGIAMSFEHQETEG